MNLLCRVGLHKWTPWTEYDGIRLVNIQTGQPLYPAWERECTRPECRKVESR